MKQMSQKDYGTDRVSADNTKYYTAKEVAKLLKVDPRTVYRWIYAGKIEAIRPDPSDNPTAPNLIPATEIPTFLRKRGGDKS